MTPDELRLVNEQQILDYARGYDPCWRLMKLMSLVRQLNNRDAFAAHVRSQYKDVLPTTDDYFFNAYTNGTLFDAVSEVVMYGEDLFALLRAIHSPSQFANRLITYKAGQIAQVAAKLEGCTVQKTQELFLVPCRDWVTAQFTGLEHADTSLAFYDDGVCRLHDDLTTTVAWFRRFEEFHMQYKHGLTLVLNGIHDLTPSEISERRANTEGWLGIYENDNVAGTAKRGQAMFWLDESTQPHIEELASRRNLLKMHFYLGEVSVDIAVEQAWAVYRLITALLFNRMDYISPRYDGLFCFSIPSSQSKGNAHMHFDRKAMPSLKLAPM